MGLLFRCTTCSKEMVLESFHRGRNVRCPHCSERNDIPERLDFENIHRETVRDAERGSWMLSLAIASLVVACFPMSAFLWWKSGGAIDRARDQEREIEPTLVWSRWVSIVATVLWGLLWIAAGVSWARNL